MKYCINIDWFEVFTYEPSDCTGVSWYESLGFTVAMRDYGTRVYRQMFTLIGRDGKPWLEVRRDPASKKSQGGVLDDRACSLRLVNRALYDWQPLDELYNFLISLGFHYRKYELCCVTRADICVDFNEDAMQLHGESVQCAEFIRQYMAGDYWKIGAAKTQAFGEEFSTGMKFHALKFGSPTSMVSTKLYNKSLEMAQVKVKPYIIEHWIKAGLLSDEYDTSQVWRLEFSIKGNADQWLSESMSPAGERYYQNNSLESWVNTSNWSRFVRGLCSHYFMFAYKDECTSKYKCERFCPITVPADVAYKPIHIKNETQTSGRTERILVNKLLKIRESGVIPTQYRGAIDCSLWFLQQLYCNHAVSRSVEDDAREFTRIMEDYNVAMIRKAFENIITDVDLDREKRDVAELCWGLWNRELTDYCRALAVNEPYSITAVRFLETNQMTAEERIAAKHFKALAEYREERLGLEYEGAETWGRDAVKKWEEKMSRSDTK